MNKILLLGIIPLLAGCFEYSDGERRGTITKLSKKGFFCKTWEGEMYMGGMKKQSHLSDDGKSLSTSMVANTFEFTVEDEKLIPSLKAKMESGDVVIVHYKEEVFSFCRSDSKNYFVDFMK